MKFKDADLIGIPLRITIGGRGLKNGVIELKWRDEEDKQEVAIAKATSIIASAIREKASN